MKSLKMLVSSLALLLSVTVVLLGCDGDKGTGGSGGGTNTGGSSGNKCGVDGTAKSCKTVEIGGQTWMAENLNRKTGNSKCYGDADSNCVKYGRLYDWKTAVNACPNGWKLPDTADWNALVMAIGEYTAGKALKSKSGWENLYDGSSGNGTDEHGFSALPGGRIKLVEFVEGGEDGYWWTATELAEIKSFAAYRNISFDSDGVYKSEWGKSNGLSVRCIKN